MLCTQTLRSLGQVKLDDFGRAAANQEKCFDFRAPCKQLIDNPVQLHIGISKASKIAFFHDRRCEARFCENHNPCC